ncbi:MAG: GDP-mannose 4,6-dehydratase [Promethearchaeota archaeon]
MNGKKIHVVTGGAGFIGSHVTRALVSLGFHVKVIDNLSSSSINSIKDLVDAGDVEFFKVDIRNSTALDEIFNGGEQIIYHLAADPRVKESVGIPVESFAQNVTGTMNLLEIMRLKGVKQMVFASSGGTLYGDVSTFPTPESAVLKPISPYGASKAAAEMYLSAYASSYMLKIVSLRFANIYGPGSNHGVMYDFFHKLKKDPTKLVILGDGTQSKSYLFIDDCVKAILMVSNWMNVRPEGNYEYFNLGTENWTSVADLAEIMVKTLGLGAVEFEYTGGERGWVGDVAKNLLDIKKIQGELGWKPAHGIEEGIRKYMESLQKIE